MERGEVVVVMLAARQNQGMRLLLQGCGGDG